MNAFTFAAISNIALVVTILLAIYLTNSLIPLFGLFYFQVNHYDKKEDENDITKIIR